MVRGRPVRRVVVARNESGFLPRGCVGVVVMIRGEEEEDDLGGDRGNCCLDKEDLVGL